MSIDNIIIITIICWRVNHQTNTAEKKLGSAVDRPCILLLRLISPDLETKEGRRGAELPHIKQTGRDDAPPTHGEHLYSRVTEIQTRYTVRKTN